MPSTRIASIVLIALLLPFLLAPSTVDATLRWRKLTTSPPDGFRHDDIFFIDPLTGWGVNLGGLIFKTTDGGATWDTLLIQPQTPFRCIGFANPMTGWAASLGPGCFQPTTDSTLVFATTDGGANWSAVTNIPEPKPKGLCGMSVVNEGVVYAAGRVCDTPRVIKTTDQGLTWGTIDMSPYASRLIDCKFFSPDSGFAVGGIQDTVAGQSRALVLFTSNGGASWVTRHVGSALNQWCWKISFPTRSVGCVAVQANGASPTSIFLKTTDGGETWVEKLTTGAPTAYFMQGIGFATEMIGWIGGSNESYMTTDGGDTWTMDPNFGSGDDDINRFQFLHSTLGYSVGRKVFKYSDDAAVGVAAVGDREAASPLALHAVHPNPFCESTTIGYALPRAGEISLRLYDALGREAVTVEDGWRAAGSHWSRLPAKSLQSGVYFLHLRGAGVAETRKVALVR